MRNNYPEHFTPAYIAQFPDYARRHRQAMYIEKKAQDKMGLNVIVTETLFSREYTLWIINMRGYWVDHFREFMLTCKTVRMTSVHYDEQDRVTRCVFQLK